MDSRASTDFRYWLGAWLLGFLLVANVYLMPGNPRALRAMDIAGVLLWVWFLLRLMSSGVAGGRLAILVSLNLLPLAWGGYAYMHGLRPTFYLSARWLLALPLAYLLPSLMAQGRWRYAFLWGLWWGLVLNILVLLAQQFGLESLTVKLGLAGSDSSLVTVNRFLLRNPGMHGHPNASAAVASLSVPVGLYLYYRRRAGIWLPVLSVGMILAAAHITASRSPLIVAVVICLLASLLSRHTARALSLMVVLALGAILYLSEFGLPGGAVRWEDTAGMSANTSERLASNVTAARLASERPWGYGLRPGHQAMEKELEAPATHNAFLQVALVFGAPLALALLILLFSLSLRLLGGLQGAWALEGLLAGHLVGLYMFEEHLNNPTFIVLTSWLSLAAVLRLGSSAPARKQRAELVPVRQAP